MLNLWYTLYFGFRTSNFSTFIVPLVYMNRIDLRPPPPPMCYTQDRKEDTPCVTRL